MKVIKHDQVTKEDATNVPLFYGGAVSRQPLVDANMSKYFSFSIVNFDAGAKNKFHAHSSDQILLVTDGTGIVADENEEHVVTVGTTIHIPAGEKHWHGATDNSAFSHISLTSADSQTETLG